MTEPTVREQVLTGVLSQEAFMLVTRTAAAVTRTGRFTTPNGAREWSFDDVEDLVGDFFAKPGRLTDVAVGAGTGADAEIRFRGGIETALKRLLIDRLRKGPQGVLYKRIDRRMAKRPDVTDVPPEHWALLEWATQPHWGGDDEVLTAAAAGIPVDAPPPWPEDSDRAAPATTGRSIDAVCTAVLGAAESPVARSTVRRLVTGRIIAFGVRLVSTTASVADPAAPPQPDAADLAAAEQAAAYLWGVLDDDDRHLLPHLTVPARQLEAQGFLGLRKSAIDARQRRLEARVQKFVAEAPDPELTGRALLRLCEDWTAGHPTGGST